MKESHSWCSSCALPARMAANVPRVLAAFVLVLDQAYVELAWSKNCRRDLCCCVPARACFFRPMSLCYRSVREESVLRQKLCELFRIMLTSKKKRSPKRDDLEELVCCVIRVARNVWPTLFWFRSIPWLNFVPNAVRHPPYNIGNCLVYNPSPPQDYLELVHQLRTGHTASTF